MKELYKDELNSISGGATYPSEGEMLEKALKNGAVAAGVGAAIGAPGGPVGVAAGAIVGSVLGIAITTPIEAFKVSTSRKPGLPE